MELLISGLDTVRTEDNTVCFVHPTNSKQYTKKRQDMPGNFQKIYEEWAKFDQPITRFKNNIKVGRKRTYNLSIWLGSKIPTKTIFDACELGWEEERENGGLVKFSYKRMQSLHTSQNLMLIGVPTDVEAEGLQMKMQEKMEETRLKMIDQNQFRYRTIVKAPKFVLEKDFIKNTPYVEQLDEDDIPGWDRMPFHLECVATNEDHLDQILAYMYHSKQGNNGHKNLVMEWSTSLSVHIRFHLIGRDFDSSGINLIKGSFVIQAVKDAAQAVVGKDGWVKSLHQAEAELILSNHDKTQSWVNLELGMTKKQLDDYERKRITHAKTAEGQTGVYNFDDVHPVTPVEGRPDDGTAFTKTANLSLGNTAYNVVMDDESEMYELATDLYEDEEGVSMDLDINQVHQDTGRLHQWNTETEEGTGAASKELQMTLSKQSGSNKGSSRVANSSGSGCTQTLTTGLAKSSLNFNKPFSVQGQEGKQTGVKPLAPSQK
jgi:hypothetical protein